MMLMYSVRILHRFNNKTGWDGAVADTAHAWMFFHTIRVGGWSTRSLHQIWSKKSRTRRVLSVYQFFRLSCATGTRFSRSPWVAKMADPYQTDFGREYSTNLYYGFQDKFSTHFSLYWMTGFLKSADTDHIFVFFSTFHFPSFLDDERFSVAIIVHMLFVIGKSTPIVSNALKPWKVRKQWGVTNDISY